MIYVVAYERSNCDLQIKSAVTFEGAMIACKSFSDECKIPLSEWIKWQNINQPDKSFAILEYKHKMQSKKISVFELQ